MKKMEKVLIFGIKNSPPDLYEIVEKKYQVIGILDNNKLVQHTYVNGKYVYPPEELDRLSFDKIVIGAASHTATRQIFEECLNRGIEKTKIINEYTIKTQDISTKQLFVMQHKKNSKCRFENFSRMNLLIHYAFVEQYYGKNELGFQLADKYMKLVCEEERALNHTKYFSELIESMEKYGYYKKSYIAVNREGELIDGTHRFSYLLWKNVSTSKVDIFNSILNLGAGGNRDLNWMMKQKEIFSQKDIICLEMIYAKIVKQLRINNNLDRKVTDLWRKKES